MRPLTIPSPIVYKLFESPAEKPTFEFLIFYKDHLSLGHRYTPEKGKICVCAISFLNNPFRNPKYGNEL